MTALAGLDWGHAGLWLAGMVFAAAVQRPGTWPLWRQYSAIALWPLVAVGGVAIVVVVALGIWFDNWFSK